MSFKFVGIDAIVFMSLTLKDWGGCFVFADSIVNDQVCPDFTTESVVVVSGALGDKLPSRTLAVNLPRHDGKAQKNYDIPCNFRVKGSHGKTTNVGVRGIHRSSTPWNFDLSDTCSSFIKV